VPTLILNSCASVKQFLRALELTFFICSDFPTLSGGPRPTANNQPGSLNYNAVRQGLGQQQPPPQQPQQPQRAPSTAPSLPGSVDGQVESRSISQQRPQDDFPALAGRQQTLNGDHGNGTLASPAPSNAQQQTTLPMREASNSAFQQPPQQAPIGAGQPLSNGGQAAATGASATGIKKYADMTDREKYGLTALTAAIESRNQRESGHPENVDQTLPPAYRSNIFLGHQLDNLDLDLNSPDPILPTFHVWGMNGNTGSPFDYRDRMTIPDFTLPPAYQVGNVPSIEGRKAALSDGMSISIPSFA
jgi:CCR4-NOT transcription complex subunit 2